MLLISEITEDCCKHLVAHGVLFGQSWVTTWGSQPCLSLVLSSTFSLKCFRSEFMIPCLK